MNKEEEKAGIEREDISKDPIKYLDWKIALSLVILFLLGIAYLLIPYCVVG